MINFIKSFDETIYENFVSLTNNIKNRDKNINSQFRITAESILSHIDNAYLFQRYNYNIKSTSIKNYGTYLSSNKFMLGLLNLYKFNQKTNRILRLIQENGNESIHSDLKIFDYNDAKEKFRYLFFIIIRVYETEQEVKLNKSQKEIDEFFDNIYENGTTIPSIIDIDNKVTKEELISLNADITSLYIEIANKEIFYSLENLKKIFVLLEKYIDYIKANNNIYDTEKLNENGYKKIYTFYKYLNTILSIHEIEDINDIIYNIEDNMFDIKHLIEVKNDIILFDWYKIDLLKEEKEKFKEINNYEKIATEIEKVPLTHNFTFIDGRYYIIRKKPFIINDKKYYEIELQKAVDNESKFDRKTVYTKLNINTNYSIKLSYETKKYDFLGEQTEIIVLNEWQVSIRPCELYNLVYIFTGEICVVTKDEEYYKKLNNYLTLYETNLLEIVLSKTKKYEEFIEMINDNHKVTNLFIESLNKAREVILEDTNGSNVLRYLLFTLRNTVIKKQYKKQKFVYKGNKNSFMSDMVLDIGCMQFDKSPLSAHLKEHVNSFKNVLSSIQCECRECEMLAHEVDKINVESQKLFVSLDELPNFKNINELIEEYKNILCDNAKSYERRLEIKDNYIYKNDYVIQAKEIIEILKEFSTSNSTINYKKLLENSNILNEIDNDEKKYLIQNLFDNSKISFIYGEAGAGKTEILANYLSKVFINHDIVYIANTHNAKENLRRRVLKVHGDIPSNIKFYTINQFNSIDFSKISNFPQIILIDESKVISNEAIYKLLKTTSLYEFGYMVFAGDVSQLNAIKLGNWFDLSKKLLNEKNIFDINTVFRSSDVKLKTLWTKVRNYEKDTLDYLINNGYTSTINDDIFKPKDESEIILCMNYSGMYGINKINAYFQERNKDSKEYLWGMDKYKVGDKILFNDYATKKYDGVLYNNLKGVIKNIEYLNTDKSEMIVFTVKVDEEISEKDIERTRGIIRVGGNSNSTIVMISAKKHVDKDTDEANDDAVVPFDIAYALSIHKAQGLQYKSVKIVITPESDELITNPIFYTAITRAEEQLNIYWTKTQQEKMLNILTKRNINVDAEYLYK